MFELSAEDRRRAILESIAGFLGDKALEPEVYYESDWGSEEWTRGAYAASYDLGGLHRYGKDQRTPVGRSTGPAPTSRPTATSTSTAPYGWGAGQRSASSPRRTVSLRRSENPADDPRRRPLPMRLQPFNVE